YSANKMALQVAVAPSVGDPRSPEGANLNSTTDVKAETVKLAAIKEQINKLQLDLADIKATKATRAAKLSILKEIKTLKVEKLSIEKKLKLLAATPHKNTVLSTVDTKVGEGNKILTTKSTHNHNFKNGLKITSAPTGGKTHSFKTSTMTVRPLKNVNV